MADIYWPVGLQELLNVAGFNIKLGSKVIRSENDIGPDKIRARTTRGIDQFTCSVNLKMEEYDEFYDFFNVFLNGGVNQFVFPHPITQVDSYFRFLDTPGITPLGGTVFVVNMSWELLGDV